MTNLSSLSKSTKKSSKIIGRGQGTGKAKTSGRGQKGQNARHAMSITHSHYEGGQRPLMKRLPYRRGKGNSKVSVKPVILTVDALEKAGIKGPIDINILIEKGLAPKAEAQSRGIKVLGGHKTQKSYGIKISQDKNTSGNKVLTVSKNLQKKLLQ
jgi:large subunit ribosomal protein L15